MLRPVLLAAAACALVAGCASAAPVGLPTTRDVVGTCKRLQTAEEMIALSDVSPAVSCRGPHVYETYAVVRVPTALAHLKERPGPEIVNAQTAGTCPYKPIRPYLGAHALDSQWGVEIWGKVPTRAEWARGVRTMVCNLVVSAERQHTVPLVDFPLRNVMRYTDSARVRLCRTGLGPATYLTCDRPHIGEQMGSVSLSSKLDRGALTAAGKRACTRRVLAYTGHKHVTGFVGEWDPTGGSSGDCWLVSTRGPVTGTERGGLVAR